MKLRIAAIGAGRIGKLHAANAAAHPRAQVVAIHDVNQEHAEALAKRHGVRAYLRLEDALADCDAAVVASSTDTHAAIALAVAQAGRPMYLEKPIDLDFEKATGTARALRSIGVPIMVGFNRRFDEAYRALRREVGAGEVGRLQIIQMTSRGPNEAPSVEYITHSGGIYRDKGIHFFDLLRYITGREVLEVYAMGATHADPHIAELGDVDTCAMQLRLDDDSLCQIDNSRRAVYGFDERIEVFGTRGIREIGRWGCSTAPADEACVFGTRLPRGFMDRFASAFRQAMDAFVRLVLDRESEVPTIEDAIAAQVIAEAASLSSRERRPVRIPAMARGMPPD
jgi:myo-inositol 2-dehydrogenase/D-chiro-inositol 1-dehydrogenase